MAKAKGGKKTPERDDPARAPLEWLIDFANAGLDRMQPRGPVERLKRSRFLSGYTPDPERPRERRERAVHGLDVVTQDRQPGMPLRWLEINGEMIPYPEVLGPRPIHAPELDPDRTPFEDLLKRLLEALPSPRGVMPVPPEGLRWTLPPADESREEADEILRGFWQVQNMTRELLRRLWCLSHETNYYGLSIELETWASALILRTAADAIGQSCLGRKGAPDPEVLDFLLRVSHEKFGNVADDTEVACWRRIVDVARIDFRIICQNRARVWVDRELTFVADSLPGIVWAEVLNLLGAPGCLPREDFSVSNPALGLLACCTWCGAFFLRRDRSRGPKREFCDTATCGKRFSLYGRGDQT